MPLGETSSVKMMFSFPDHAIGQWMFQSHAIGYVCKDNLRETGKRQKGLETLRV